METARFSPGTADVLLDDVTARRRGDATLARNEKADAFLLRLGDALRPLRDTRQVQAVASRMLGEHTGLASVGYCDVAPDQDTFVAGGEYGDGRMPPLDGWRSRISNHGPGFGPVLRAGRTVSYSNLRTDPRAHPGGSAEAAPFGVVAGAAVPLIKDGRLVAFFYFGHPEPHTWHDDELSLLKEVAERTWAAVERARAEALLAQSESRLRTLVESITDYAIFTLDIEGRVTSWNEGARRLKGFTSEEILGEPVSRFYTAQDVAAGKPARVLERAIAAGRSEDEGWRVRKDGSLFWADQIVTPLCNVDGRVVGFTKVSRDLTERKAFEDALKLANDSLERQVRDRTSDVRALLQRLMTAHEDERRRVSGTIHDQLGQPLTALRVHLDALKANVRGDAILNKQVERTQLLACRIDDTIETLSRDLHPPALDQFGLSAALRDLVGSWSGRSGVRVAFDVVGDDRTRLPAEEEANLYRIVQEAMEGVTEHAAAHTVVVTLERHRREDVLSIEADGGCFDDTPADGSPDARLGLLSMRERATLIGAAFELTSRRGGGTRLVVRLRRRVSARRRRSAHVETGVRRHRALR